MNYQIKGYYSGVCSIWMDLDRITSILDSNRFKIKTPETLGFYPSEDQKGFFITDSGKVFAWIGPRTDDPSDGFRLNLNKYK